MHRLILRTFLALVPLALVTSSSFAETALVWATGNAGAGTQVVADYIESLGCFDTVDGIDADFVPLATLTNYDAVLYFSNGSGSQNPTAIGDVLADYADTGRRLVLATFSWADQGSNTLGGRLILDGISPLLTQGTSLYTNVTMASNDGSGFFTGVATVNGFYHDNVMLSGGAVERGTWSDGEPLLATKGNVVGVNLFPDDTWGQVSGDHRQLFANAMCFELATPILEASWGVVKQIFQE